MCGIVGILGREPVAGLLVDALKRLEYRGYDSAGVATLESGQLVRRRAEGKLRNLEARLTREPLARTNRLGPTRRAAARLKAMRTLMPPSALPLFTMASSRISASCARSWKRRARSSARTPTRRW